MDPFVMAPIHFSSSACCSLFGLTEQWEPNLLKKLSLQSVILTKKFKKFVL